MRCNALTPISAPFCKSCLATGLRFALAASATFMACSSITYAETLTFEGLASGSNIPDGYGGLNWSSDFYVLDADAYQSSGYKNGMVTPVNVAYNGWANDVMFNANQVFTLSSAYITGAWNNGLSVTVTGYRNGVEVASQTVTVNATGPTLATFNWSGIDEVRWSSSGGADAGLGGGGTHFALDNLSILFVTLSDLQASLVSAASGGTMALSSSGMVFNGAHSRPLARRVAAGQKVFWVAGDWGTDKHASRNGEQGLAEAGLGYNFGPAQLNVSLGQTWAKQNHGLNGRSSTDGRYLLAQALIPVSGNLWATLGGYGHWGNTDLRRGYLNAGLPDESSATPDVNTWGLRARLDWDNAYHVAGTHLTPYVDFSHIEAMLSAYTETGGAYPARFDARKEKATELRFGMNATKPLFSDIKLLGTVEAVHRFEKSGAHSTGQVIGLFDFDLDGQKNKRNWLRFGVGLEGKLATGVASLSLNVTTKGEAPNTWLAASWQKAF